jgi:signal transduction histidine kinase
MDADAVIAARPLRRALIRNDEPVAGYLYLVCHKPVLPEGRIEALRSSFALPALGSIVVLVALTTLLAAWIIGVVTRPLRQLTRAVAAVAREGLDAGSAAGAGGAADMARALPELSARDEFGQLTQGFRSMLATLRMQWDALRRLDHFRREGVSNLSHDLRSPLTATVACLETLDRRWAADPARADDRAMLEVALRNTRNAAQLVRSLGDLALLDEPAFKLQPMTVDLGELLDDIVMRFAGRAAQQEVALRNDGSVDGTVVAAVDIELFERAVANLVDNALKHTAAGGQVTLQARNVDHQVQVTVRDDGSGIAAEHLQHLFDRLYTGSGARGDADGGKGLGLAIVKRIVELHHGEVAVHSEPARGTEVTIRLPRDAAAAAPPTTAPAGQ